MRYKLLNRYSLANQLYTSIKNNLVPQVQLFFILRDQDKKADQITLVGRLARSI